MEENETQRIICRGSIPPPANAGAFNRFSYTVSKITLYIFYLLKHVKLFIRQKMPCENYLLEDYPLTSCIDEGDLPPKTGPGDELE